MLALTVLGLTVLLAYSVLAATVLPRWIVSLNAGPNADAIANTRGALLGVLAPVVVAIGAVAAFLNYRETAAQNRRTVELSRDTLRVTERGQLTERFTRAIGQLGQTDEDKLDIRLGGIYALEQIAKESKELHRPVMEILTAFLREHSRKPREASAEFVEGGVAATAQSDAASNEQAVPLQADFQAIATVLGRREVSHDPDGFRLDLRGVALGLVDFEGAQLQGASFWNAQLQNARFDGAQLQNARFDGAQLQGASFWKAQLQGASFLGSQLQNAIFAGAQLQKASFAGAQLQNARFDGAQLQGASFWKAQLQKTNFERSQLQGAIFAGAQLQKTNFALADLEGAKFQHGETDAFDAQALTPEQFYVALNVDKAILPNYLISALESKGVVRPAE